MRFFVWLFLLTTLSLWASPKEFTVNLKNPEYQGGVISTHQGGVIKSPEIRIQARHIIYIQKVEKGEEVHRVIAEGNLMLDSGGHTYVGRRLEYDFVTKTGVVYDGVTAIDLWFLGGEKIRLNSDRSFYLYNSFVTTSESQKADWKLHTHEVEITKKNYLYAKNVTFRFFETPILWLPTFKSNLKYFADSPVRYKVDWDTGLFPKLSMRYRVYSSEFLDLYFKLNVRASKGVGGAMETDYKSLDKRTKFRTRSYLDHDAFYRDTQPDQPRTHYRMQGQYDAISENERATFHAHYDWLSDKNMQTDFGSEDFELNTTRQTALKIRTFQDWMIFGVNGKFRVNGFQGMKQELPESFWTPKPFVLGSSGIVSENRLNLAYLDYVSAKEIEPDVPDFSAARLSAHHTLCRSFSAGGFSLTPLVGIDGVFYGDSQQEKPAALGVLSYQLIADLTLKKNYHSFRHVLKPYLHYRGMTHPTISPNTPYIFSIQDGFNRLNVIQSGVRNLFYFKNKLLFEPNIIADLSSFIFLGDETFQKAVPKARGTFIWNFPSWKLSSKLGWNIEKQVLDYANIGLAWTINEQFAFKTEFRHRSRFDWRKGDPDNFVMEITRPISELLHSPLSDGRNTLLTRLQMQLAPQWTVRFDSHIGWGRGGEPNYNEARVELITLISTSWCLRLIFVHSPAPHKKNDRFTFGMSLVKK